MKGWRDGSIVRALAVLSKHLGSIPSPPSVAHHHWNLSSRGSEPLLASQVTRHLHDM